jgi:hypothetical protein
MLPYVFGIAVVTLGASLLLERPKRRDDKQMGFAFDDANQQNSEDTRICSGKVK